MSLAEIYDGSPTCRGSDPDEWSTDHVRGEAARAALARDLWDRFCIGCPVRDLCLQWALAHAEHGIWAGTTERQRRRMNKTAAPVPSAGAAVAA